MQDGQEYIPKHVIWEIPNPYNLPVHDQGNESSCTAHSFASVLEHQLSEFFKERALIDVDDLWNKQKKYGTATDAGDISPFAPWLVCEKYGVIFKTDSGKRGIYFLGSRIELLSD